MYEELIRQYRDKAERHRIEGKPGLARDYINAADAIAVLLREVQKYRRQHPVIPAADVVAVVRCRECENWDTEWKPNHAEEGQYFCPILGQVTDTDFYCGCGTRKGGGQEPPEEEA